MSEAPRPPETPREDVERAPVAPQSESESEIERAAGEETDQAGMVSPELGPTSH